jgi:DICT domain-containing protein
VVHFIDPGVQPPTRHLPPKEDKKVDEAPVVNPELSKWVAKDQQVLSYLLTSLSCEIGSQVSSATTAAAAVDLEFNPVVTAVGARVEPISIN